MARVRVRLLARGYRSVLHEQGVYGMLNGQAAKAASRCNAICDPDLKAQGASYGYGTKKLAWCAAALVFCETREAGIDNLKNNTLKKGVGI